MEGEMAFFGELNQYGEIFRKGVMGSGEKPPRAPLCSISKCDERTSWIPSLWATP